MRKDVAKRALLDTLHAERISMILMALVFITNFGIFALYKILMEPLIYVAIITVLVWGLSFLLIFFLKYNRGVERTLKMEDIYTSYGELPSALSCEEEDYQEMIRILVARSRRIETEFDADWKEMQDYYTAWVHQIKTPIAVMKLQLGDEDSAKNRALLAELFRIEQYVDMVLQYIRISSQENDLVIKEYSLDDLVRESIRKYASQFILKKLSMDFTPSGKRIVTDSKWFAVMLDQILSNAIKYTSQGGIKIYVDESDRLIIEDSGMGIAQEDIPRIFEKGFTGNNGRIEKRSSGLGLYLCKKTGDKLNISVSVESTVGKGTCFALVTKFE